MLFPLESDSTNELIYGNDCDLKSERQLSAL